MDFIFMLTRSDRTVEDCLELMEQIAPLRLGHVGFKDIGVSLTVLDRLAQAIRDSGAISYMEVVSTSPEDCLRSARIARDLGVDRLLGGTQVDETLAILEGSRTAYFPFPGRPVGHPTRLGGHPLEIEQHCRAFMRKGCAGVDLLAYRSTEADPLDLVRAARRGLGEGSLIAAGSVTSAERIQALRAAGADAFTIGSAVFDGSFSPAKGSTLSQLADVLAACGSTASEPAAAIPR
ncbi:4-hydroxythreonine-4-phosphate dehydrogenase [Labrys miyagiensis]